MAGNGPCALDALREEIERMLYAGESRPHVLARLADVARRSEEASADWLFAVRTLATLGASENPWKASLLARRVIAHAPHAADAWAALGLAQSILGNLGYAVHCYERAVGLVQHASTEARRDEPTLLHNLGHLYDVALDRPRDAVPLLSTALDLAVIAKLPRATREEIAASLAHALARAGERGKARDVFAREIRSARRPAYAELSAFLQR
jgi:tetratricopeptide (TPR) repeat protein